MEISDKYQGLCLVDYRGSETIAQYDKMSPEARQLVRNSSFNICPACIMDIARELAFRRTNDLIPDLWDYQCAIHRMETQIRCEEVQ